MKLFALLYDELDQALFPDQRVSALERYFRTAPAHDAAWGLHLLMGNKLSRIVPLQRLRSWVGEETGWRDWMLEECHEVVKDWVETAHLLLPAAVGGRELCLRDLIEQKLIPLSDQGVEAVAAATKKLWREFDGTERYLVMKLMGEGLRVPANVDEVAEALSNISGLSRPVIQFRLSRYDQASDSAFAGVMKPLSEKDAVAKPFPFMRALKQSVEPLGWKPQEQWMAEWRLEGIRVQLIRRQQETLLWAEASSVLNSRFPMIARLGEALPDGTVIDGVLVIREGVNVGPVDVLYQNLTKRSRDSLQLEDVTIVLMAFDLLEDEGRDLREEPLRERRLRLEALLERVGAQVHSLDSGSTGVIQGELFAPEPNDQKVCPIQVAEPLAINSQKELLECLEKARSFGASGVVLKRLNSGYCFREEQSDWIRYDAKPLSLLTVLISAQAGTGRKGSVYAQYHFGVWMDGRLVSVATVSGGLSREEEAELDQFIRSHTIGRHGPVRSVRPAHVFKLHFAGVNRSRRHRSGITLRSPRIAEWCRDSSPEEADSIESLLT